MIQPYKIYLLTLLMLLCGSLIILQAQSVATDYTLHADESGASKAYVARDYISMKPGFRYAAANGTTFNAKIDRGLLFPPSDATYLKPDGSTTSDPTKGVAVGSIPGKFEVGPTGAATYTIPIACPQGINGMQPDISLTYSSQGGNGIAGCGWNVGGLPAITRTKKTNYFDGEDSGITWDAACPLSLDGQRLIKISESGGQIEYRTENESFNKIVGYEIQAWGPKFFKVYTKSGMVLTYGNPNSLASYSPVYNNPASDALAQTNFQRASWNLVEMMDNNGNYATFSYKASQGNDIGNVIDRIVYGSNRALGALSSIAVSFDYEKRVDELSGYISGMAFIQQLRLKNIRTSVNGQEQKVYSLTYSNATQSKLQSIELFQNGSKSYSPVSFVYGQPKEAESQTDITFITKDVDNNTKKKLGLVAVDLDGDGCNELGDIYTESFPGFEDVLINCFFDIHKKENNWVATHRFMINTTLRKVIKGLPSSFGDFNGNGSSESVSPSSQNNSISLNITDMKDNTLLFEESIGNSSKDPFIAIGNFYGQTLSGALVIFNDPVSENGMYKYPYCIVAANKNQYVIKRPYWTESTNYYYLYTSKKIESIEIENLNARNFRNDIWINYEDGTNAILKNKMVGYNCFTGGAELLQPLPFNIEKDDIYRVADMNADGLPDVVYRKNSNDWYIAYNKGNYNFKMVALNIDCGKFSAKKNPILNDEDDKDNLFITDINNDGLPDIVAGDENLKETNIISTELAPWGGYQNVIKYDYSFLNTTWRIYLNTGNMQFQLNRTVTSKERSAYTCVADLLGKGTVNWIYEDSSGKVQFTDFGYATNSSLLTKVSDSFTGEQTISYKPLSSFTQLDNQADENNYTWTTLSYLNAGVMPIKATGILLVSSYEKGISKSSYYYGKALFNWEVRGLSGFQYMATKDELSTNSSIIYKRPFPTNHLLLPVKTINSMGLSFAGNKITPTNIVSRDVLEYPVVQLGNKRYTAQQKSVTTYDYLHDKTHLQSFEYDPYGNLTKYFRKYGIDISEETTSSYIACGSWCPGKIDSTTFKRTILEGEEEFTWQKNFTYDQKGNLSSQTDDPGDQNSLKTEYLEIDSCGYAGKVKVSANGISRISSISYTPSKRFVKSKTDILGRTNTYNWNETKGLLDSETDEYGTTTYTYDNTGKLAETKSPDGIRVATSLQWASSGSVSGAKYYQFSQTSGQSPVYIWYDTYGREILKQAYGLNGQLVDVASTYNDRGLPYKLSKPYFHSAGSPSAWDKVQEYDNYNRLLKLTTPMGETSYEYLTYMTVETNPTDTITKTFNAAGEIMESVRNGHYVDYEYYPSGKLKASWPFGAFDIESEPVKMEYDLQGNRTKITDPDAGVVESKYNGFGELLWERQLVHEGADSVTTTNQYDNYGLLQSTTRHGHYNENKVFSYDSDLGHPTRVKSIEIAGRHKQTFTYDSYGRQTNLKEEIDGRIYNRSTEYDALGRIRKDIYPSGYFTTNTYDSYGNLTETRDQAGRSIWKPLEENVRRQLTKVSQGGHTTSYAFDERGFPTAMDAGNVVSLAYSFDTKGNLQYRTDSLTGQEENFSYDRLSRLAGWTVVQPERQTAYGMNYSPEGNIETKTDLGNFTLGYGANGKPHALTSVSGTPSGWKEQGISYTDFKKVQSISDPTNLRSYALTYGVDDQRRKSTTTQYWTGANPGSRTTTRYYIGDYEEEITPDGNVRKIHYLSGAVLIRNRGVDSLLYTYSDYLGSLTALADENGNVVQRYAYDPWGKRRNPSDWTLPDSRTSWILNRGFTGHEHLDKFGVIDMNGRVYDPLTGQFFSPDPYISFPGDWVGYNRYLYAMGNPFKFTDPSGENALLIIAIGMSAISFGAVSAMNGGSFWAGALTGAAVGAISFGVGTAASAVVSASVGSSSGFLGGFLTGFSGGFSGGFVSGAIGALGQGAGGGRALKSGLMSGLISGGIAGLTTGFQYGSTAVKGGGNWLTGKNTISDYNSGISGGTPLSKKAYDSYRESFGSINDESLIERSKAELNYSNGDYNASLTSEANYENGYWQDLDGYFGKMSGNSPVQIPGYTKSLGIFRGSEIHISPAVTNNFDIPGQFKAVVGHELIHAIHLNMGLSLGRDSEIIAHRYTIQSYFNAGNSVKALNAYLTAYSLGYIGNAPSAYNIANYMYTNHFSYRFGN